jgi:hypothetical protein
MRPFRINESERQRILGMHSDAVKKHYLSEQDDNYEFKWDDQQLRYHQENANRLYNSQKPDVGGKFCFSEKQDRESVISALDTNIKNSGVEGKVLYKIKEGDTPNGIKLMSPDYDVIGINSKSCDMNKPRIGDVILYMK